MRRNKIITGLGVLLTAIYFNPVLAQDLPTGMVFFVASSECPSGTNAAKDAAGRIVIVTTDTSQIGKTYGDAMEDQKDNTHTHKGSMTVNLPEHHVAGASSCCNGQATTKGKHTASITTGPSTTNLPFIQLLACTTK
ncbi:hypothetical protein ACFODZ_03775 [Marinicella sediminis]|uniref:Uncharacterized protein n=1 Tax=Marinicella sediminis TaxID=1792834 RepID=A0ABV7JAT6_9GAMM|nr:hypothetical protein [Marinicella sediminis]